jgi:transposase-like protein
MKVCSTCTNALKVRIVEQKLKRKRYIQNMVYFQSEIEALDIDIARLLQRVKHSGQTISSKRRSR